MKKYIICFSLFCYLLYSNITLVSASQINNYDVDPFESVEMPQLLIDYENYSSPRSATLTLGSLGLATAEGVAILGGAASVVGALLGLVAAGGLALVVGQGLVNIYDRVHEYALSKDEAEKLQTSVSVDKKGNAHLQLVPKDPNTGQNKPLKPSDDEYIKVVLPFIQNPLKSPFDKNWDNRVSYSSLNWTFISGSRVYDYSYFKPVNKDYVFVQYYNSYGDKVSVFGHHLEYIILSGNKTNVGVGYGGYSYNHSSKQWSTIGSSSRALIEVDYKILLKQ